MKCVSIYLEWLQKNQVNSQSKLRFMFKDKKKLAPNDAS